VSSRKRKAETAVAVFENEEEDDIKGDITACELAIKELEGEVAFLRNQREKLIAEDKHPQITVQEVVTFFKDLEELLEAER
jgi:hypothetical protein